MEVQVRVLEIFQEQRGQSAKGEWVKNQFLAETVGEYPKKLLFEVMGEERFGKMKQYLTAGVEAKISFDVESREWNGKWFTSLRAFSVYTGQQPSGTQEAAHAPQQATSAPASNGQADNLPF